MHFWATQFPSPLFFLKKKLCNRFFFLYPSKYNLTVQSPGPSSRDILGETHLLNIGKLANVISDMSFLNSSGALSSLLLLVSVLH